MSTIYADQIAARGHRLYVFGVVFAALFSLGFVLIAMVVADFSRLEPRQSPLVTRRPPSVAPGAVFDKLASGERGVQHARAQLRAAELDLFRYLFDQLGDADAASMRTALQPADPTPLILRPQISGDDNLSVLEIERGLADARQRRAAMSDRLTALHPTMQNLDSTIADLETRLEAAHRSKVIEPSATADAAPIVQPASVNPAATNSAALSKARELMRVAGRADNDYQAAVANESQLRADCSHLSASSDAPPVMSIGPAVAQSGAPVMSTPKPIIAFIGLFALAAAIALAAARSAKYPPAMFASAADVETRLKLPVLGTLEWNETISNPVAGGPAFGNPRWLRRWILASEVVVALVLGGLLILAITDSALLRQTADDPLSGLAQGLARLRDLAGV